MKIRISLLILYFTILLHSISAQNCDGTIGSIYGADGSDEEGNSIAITAAGDGYYVAGSKDGLSLITKFKLNGEVEWSRSFNVIPGEIQDISSILLDADGMLALAGTTGGGIPGTGVFIFRYDPENNLILWANEIETSTNNEAHSIIQRENNGNYIISNNPHEPTNNDAELLEINKNDGSVVTSLSKNYHMTSTSSEQLTEIILHGDFLYGVGRFTDGPSPQHMRNTLVKLDKQTGDPIWVKLGHVPISQSARLYGQNMLIDNDEIYSVYLGDPAGTSTTNTKVFIQKTSLDGDLIWLKQYELPGPTDHVHEIIRSEDGFVILAQKAAFPSEVILFKIDTAGEVLWANLMQPAPFITSIVIERAISQLVKLGDHLLIAATGLTANGTSDMIVVRTDLQGQVIDGCMTSLSMSITGEDVPNPTFYPVTPEVFDVEPEVNSLSFDIIETGLDPRQECFVSDTIITNIEATICAGQIFEGYFETGIYIDSFLTPEGCDSIRILALTVLPAITSEVTKNICHDESFEGYNISGTYMDTFALSNGCDSVRILHLSVFACAPVIYYDLDACRSFMADGSHMDYSEFTPEYPEGTCGDLNAGHLYQTPTPDNKHSCTPGLNNTDAMCVGAYQSCTYTPGHSAAVLIDFSIDPVEDSIFRFSALEFYEKAPPTYSWISGPSGPNNYPLRYGLRILKNGVEIFRNENIPTNPTWTLQSFDFIDNDLFIVDESANFRIELLPYCPVGNGADVSAWDLEEIRVFAACAPIQEEKPLVTGNIFTSNYDALSGIQVKISKNLAFNPEVTAITDDNGAFAFEGLESELDYYIKGYHNEYPLNGVSALDLIYIQKHLLGTIPFSGLEKYVAADADNNGKVNVLDVLELKKLLLGINSEFKHNTSWRFGIMPQNMSGSDIISFKEVGNIKVKNDTIQSDFMGIKVGDLNGDAKLYFQGTEIDTRSINTYDFGIEDKKAEAGRMMELDIIAREECLLSGFQFAIDISGLGFVSVGEGVLKVSGDNFSISDDGILRIVWTTENAIKLSEHDVLFTVVLNPRESGLISDLVAIKNEILRPEAYTGENLETRELQLSYFQYASENLNDFITIEPNPFHSRLNILFKLKQETDLQLSLYDLSGRLLYQSRKVYLPGKYQEAIFADQLPIHEGIIYCQIISNGSVTTRKILKY